MEELKEGWRRAKLREVADIGSSKRIFMADYRESGIPFFRGKEIIQKSKGNNITTELYIAEEKYNEIKNKFEVPQKGDILLTSVGTIGVPYLVNNNEPFYFKDGNITWIKKYKNEVYNKYIYQWIKSPLGQNQINQVTIGSTQKALTIDALKKLEIDLPPLETQKKIASILSALDDKIEINNEMNKTLEEMAQTLFKRWFIDFDFPNENGEPYRSSGGKMVDSELGEIPEGWEIDSIYELAEYINGTSFKSNEYGDHGLPVIKIVELKNGITDSTKFCISDKDKKFHLKNGEILFSWSGNPQTSIDIFIWSLGKAILNQHTFKVVPYNEKIDSYIYFLLKYLKPKFCDIASNKQTTGLGHVTVKDLKNLKIAFNYEQIYKFCDISQNIFKKLLNNQQEINTLIEIRDALLPKLMNGEVEV